MPPPFNLPPVRQQGRDYSVTPVYQSGPMQPRQDVPSFDLTRNLSPGRSLVTGDRSLTRNPSGRAGMPLAPMGEQIGSRGMTDQRRSEIAGRRLSSAMRAGDMQATALLYRGPTGYGRGFGPPPSRGYTPPVQRPDSLMPQPAMPAPQAPAMPALPPPMSTEQALGLPGLTPPANDNQPAPMPMAPNLPWQGQPLPGGLPMRPTLAPMPWEPQQTFDPTQPLPPSTMNGSAGLPPPPDLEIRSLPGNPGYGVPFIQGQPQKQFLPMPPAPGPPPLNTRELQTAAANNVEPTGQLDANGLPILKPKDTDKQPRIQTVMEGDVKTNVQWNPERKRYERVKIYNPGDPDDNGIPGDQRTQAGATPATPGAAWMGLGAR